MEESIRMTENRDKWRKYVHGVANLGSRTAKEQNRTEQLLEAMFVSDLLHCTLAHGNVVVR